MLFCSCNLRNKPRRNLIRIKPNLGNMSLNGNYRVEKSSYMYDSYVGLAFGWMHYYAQRSVRDSSGGQHRHYHIVVAGGYTFDFTGKAVEPRTQSGGFAAVRRIPVDSGNHFDKRRGEHFFYSGCSIDQYSLSAPDRRSVDISATGSSTSVGALVSSVAALSDVRLAVCNELISAGESKPRYYYSQFYMARVVSGNTLWSGDLCWIVHQEEKRTLAAIDGQDLENIFRRNNLKTGLQNWVCKFYFCTRRIVQRKI